MITPTRCHGGDDPRPAGRSVPPSPTVASGARVTYLDARTGRAFAVNERVARALDLLRAHNHRGIGDRVHFIATSLPTFTTDSGNERPHNAGALVAPGQTERATAEHVDPLGEDPLRPPEGARSA